MLAYKINWCTAVLKNIIQSLGRREYRCRVSIDSRSWRSGCQRCTYKCDLQAPYRLSYVATGTQKPLLQSLDYSIAFMI